MPGPSLDLDRPNAIETLDKLTTNLAMAMIAVFPTFAICIAMPWHLFPMLDPDKSQGRAGSLLAPGAFFPLALVVVLIATAAFTTPETLSSNGSFLGPSLAVAVQTAVGEGDVWKIISLILPIYGFAVFIGLLAMLLKPWLGREWTLQISIRAAFYVTAILIGWALISGTIMDYVRLSTGTVALSASMYAAIAIPAVSFVPWIYFWLFRQGGALSWQRSVALSVSMLAVIVAAIVAADVSVRLLFSLRN